MKITVAKNKLVLFLNRLQFDFHITRQNLHIINTYVNLCLLAVHRSGTSTSSQLYCSKCSNILE